MYGTIRTAAYEPDPACGPLPEPLHVMRLGAELHAALTDLHDHARHHNGRPTRLPVRQLNSLLRALAPGVVATARNADAAADTPWLYGSEPVPAEVVGPLVGTWAAGLLRVREDDDTDDADVRAIELEDRLLERLDTVVAELPPWETEEVDLTEATVSPGGTAVPARRVFGLLPEWLAHRLAARPCHALGPDIRFRVVSREGGAELVSWPPQAHQHRKQTWYYSALITITVHTVPFAERFRVHVSTSIRRWATSLAVQPRDLRGSTVLLDTPLPWPDGPDRSRRLVENSVGYDHTLGHLVWRRHSPAVLLPDVDIVRRYPKAAEMFSAPETWLGGRDGIAAGIVYSPALGPHSVAPGLMPKERSLLDAWVEEGLRPMLRRVPDLGRVTRRNTPSLLPRSARADQRETREGALSLGRRAALAGVLAGAPLDVELLWQTPETRDALIAALPPLLGLPPGRGVRGEGETWRWQTDGVDIRVRARPAGPLADALRLPGDRRRPRALRFADAVAARCDLVSRCLTPRPDGPGVALVEIKGREGFKKVPDSDPKHALRIACAREGRLSQFITVPAEAEEALSHRARWAWLDVLRQLGAISPPEHRVGAGIPGDLQYAALWLVRHTRKGPTRCPVRRLVAVRVRPGDGTVHGWDAERAEWVPYHQLLRLLASEESEAPSAAFEETPVGGAYQQALRRRHSADETERQIRTLLYQFRDRPTLLLADLGNLRQCWPRLRNGTLVRDMLGFGTERDQRLTVYGPDLRLVLTRDGNGREEVPEWYAHDGGEKVGFSQGVWGPARPDNRVFASTTDVPHTATLPKGLMKLVPVASHRTAPRKAAWNPVYLELTVLGCLSEKALAEAGRQEETADSPAEWATLAHQLRLHDDYPPLSRPLPLHLARLAGEYVLPLAAPSPRPAEPGGDGGR
ncbi:pPIWI_RE module domain-containing protein [Streptomyces achromogenes]|uniref:pPIWI_RE module domain-containing protein n=1 Tax=Streptomyces achromogenes TaxID=67255 RepID=UPI0036F50EB2